MPQINKRKLCNKHSFYNAIDNPNGCPKCRKESNKDYDTNIRAEDRKKIYNSTKWKLVRGEAILRDEFLCQPCKRNGVETLAEEVHHVIELKDDITKAYELDNLESTCHTCHMKEHKGK